jgi:hypothetical protein
MANELNPAPYAAGSTGFMEGNALAMQQQRLQMDQGKDQREGLAHSLQMIGSIALGAKGGRMDGPVDPQRFEQGLDYLQSRGINVSQFRGRPQMADVAASASMTAMQQLQAGQMANAVQQQFLQNLLAVRRDARDEQNTQRQMGIAERAASRQGIPEGYERDPTTGTARRIAGLPPADAGATPQSAVGKLNADLAAGRITRQQFDLEQERITKQAETPLPQNVITSLGSAGKSLEDIDRFTRTFEPAFAGYRMNAIGEAANTLGRTGAVPNALGGQTLEKQAAWWQDYARYRNAVRNELFGSALTAAEQRAFEQADVTPGMSAAQIQTNLKAQQEAARRAVRVLAAPHVAAGKPIDQIEAAIGRKVEDIGIARPERRQAPQPPSATTPAAPAATPAATPQSAAPGTVLGPAPAGSPEGRTGTMNGQKVVVRNGQIVVAE